MTDLEWMQTVKGLPCAVVGLGISNLPLIDFLLSSGAYVTARDRKTREELGETADRLEAAGVRLILGERYLDDLTEKVIFRSPGLRPDLPAFMAAVQTSKTPVQQDAAHMARNAQKGKKITSKNKSSKSSKKKVVKSSSSKKKASTSSKKKPTPAKKTSSKSKKKR